MYMHVKNLYAYVSLEQNVQYISFLGVNPCYVSGQVVIIGLLIVQIHSSYVPFLGIA